MDKPSSEAISPLGSAGAPRVLQPAAGVPASWLLKFDGLLEAREVDDFEQRIAADGELLLSLQLTGFTGSLWDRFADVLARYGFAVVFGWIRSGDIVPKCVAKGLRGVRLPDHLRDRFRHPEVAHEVATDTVGYAICRFRDEVLKKGRWSPAGGASLKTYFIGQALIRFVPILRDWVRWQEEPLSSLDTDIEPSGPARDDPAHRIVLLDEVDHLKRAIGDPFNWQIAELAAEGVPQDQIALELGLQSARAVEARLYRIRSRLRGRRDTA